LARDSTEKIKIMISYKTKSKKISGSSYREVLHGMLSIYDRIRKRTKRRPYVRSAYFKKEKIFFDYFREHLFQKSPKERMKRMKFFAPSVELIKNSRIKPVFMEKSKGEKLYRFAGLTADGDAFFVQIKEDKRKRKYFMSCFPPG
jgi:hypothetical protein